MAENMDAKEKEKFVRDLVGNVLETVIKAIPAMPEDWNGHELRQYLADKFADNTFMKKGKGLKRYRNTVAVTAGL
jgi:hypothetical protein